MNYCFLFLTVVTLAAQEVFTKQYSTKKPTGAVTYAALVSISALCMFVVSSGFKFRFCQEILGYTLLFTAAYCAATVFLTLAMGCGPLSLTSLIHSYSLMIPTLYGILFLHEKVRVSMCIGMALLVLSLAMINYAKSDRKKNVKWLLYVFVAFMGNGLCSTVQKAQQVAFGGQYKNEFMILSLAGVSIILLICSLLLERGHVLSSIRRGWYMAVPCGILNGLTNLLVLLLSTKIAASLMFPILSGGNVVLTSLVSVWGYHEKLNQRQLAGKSHLEWRPSFFSAFSKMEVNFLIHCNRYHKPRRNHERQIYVDYPSHKRALHSIHPPNLLGRTTPRRCTARAALPAPIAGQRGRQARRAGSCWPKISVFTAARGLEVGVWLDGLGHGAPLIGPKAIWPDVTRPSAAWTATNPRIPIARWTRLFSGDYCAMIRDVAALRPH